MNVGLILLIINIPLLLIASVYFIHAIKEIKISKKILQRLKNEKEMLNKEE